MKKNKYYSIVLMLFLASCANEMAPSGGKRDTEAPIIKRSSPPNSTLNFKSKEIQLRFNEYIQQPLNIQEILVSPPMEKDPKYLINEKILTIKLKSEPKENTTYSINFGSSIKDNNEGNKLLNFSYVFSTGAVLDSCKISGKVVNSKDLSPAEDIVVSLYPADSINSIKTARPFYFSRTDKAGDYQIKNIKSGRYKIFALKDQNLNYKYDLPNESIGFGDTILEITDSNSSQTNLHIFEEPNKKIKLAEATEEEPGKTILIYNAPIKNIRLKSNFSSDSDLAFINSTNDTITYWHTNIYNKKGVLYFTINDFISDSTRVSLIKEEKDSLIYSNKYLLNIEKQYIIDKKGDKKESKSVIISPYEALILKLTRPAIRINQNKTALLIEDSIQKNEKLDFAFDSISKRQIVLKSDWKENTDYSLCFQDSTFQDFFGIWNKSFSYNFKTDKRENYGNVQFAFKFAHPEVYYILRLLDQAGNIVHSFYYVGNNEKKVSLKNIKAGSYKLQAVEDNNHNGEWDTGSFEEKIQPEKIINFKDSYELKGEWDLEIEIKI